MKFTWICARIFLKSRGDLVYGIEKVAPAAGALAQQPPFVLGATLVTPATRELQGPVGTATLAPRVMQLLLALADAKGEVVTRDALALRCWNGRFVAEDSLNSAIADLRRAILAASGGELAIETVPRTGYRFAGPQPSAPQLEAAAISEHIADAAANLSRRALVYGSAVGIAAVSTGIAAWRLRPDADETQVDDLIGRGSQALRDGLPEANAQGIVFLKEAVGRAPGNAAAWGKLALAWRGVVEYGDPAETAAAVANSQAAAHRALAIDPHQSDGLTALAILPPMFGDWFAAEQRIRTVLAIDPVNQQAVGALATLFMSTGQVNATHRLLSWLLQRDPLSANRQYRQVYCTWAIGRVSEADRIADRALQLWPRHPAVWFARFWTLAFTSRAAAAMAMLDDVGARPPIPPGAVAVFRATLAALATRQPAQIATAVAANLISARAGPAPAGAAIMVLSDLGAIDAAVEVARGYLTRRGPVVVQLRHTAAQPSVNDLHHRMTMMLWIPSTAKLRADARFACLCDEIGLADYWRRSGRRADEPVG